MPVRLDLNAATERISLRMKGSSYVQEARASPEDLCYMDLLLYICLFLVFLLPAKAFHFYATIFSLPP